MQYSLLIRAALAGVLATQAFAAPVITGDIARRCTSGIVGIYCPAGRPKDDAAEVEAALEKKAEMEKRCTSGIVGVYCPGGHLKDAAGESAAVLDKKAEDSALYFSGK